MNKLLEWAEQVRKAGRKISFTNGCYDLFHAGHAKLLSDIKIKYPDAELCVGINSDSSVHKLKGPGRPVINANERAYIISCHKAVSKVYVFNDDTPLALVQAIRPDVLIKGGDWPIPTIIGAKEVLSWGGIVESLPLFKREEGEVLSTSKIIKEVVKNVVQEQFP